MHNLHVNVKYIVLVNIVNTIVLVQGPTIGEHRVLQDW